MQRPDVALETSKELAPLDWVGMNAITVPVQIESQGRTFAPVAQVSAFVSLDQPSRGIHMSRLYAIVQDQLASNSLGLKTLKACVAEFLESHKELSRNAKISVALAWPVNRKALASGLTAWRTYPVTMAFESRNGQQEFKLTVEVEYSSTCPASAALSRQLIQNQFSESFASAGAVTRESVHQWLGTPQGIVATPHAQRSGARVQLTLKSDDVSVVEWIDRLEGALGTPVQTVVKREDEQAFALANGQNLMFCEDASRRLKSAVEVVPQVTAFEIEVQHFESLHPHNAVSVVSGSMR